MVVSEYVQVQCRLLLERAELLTATHPHLSAACDACVLMLLDASQADGVEVDHAAAGLAGWGAIDD